MSVKFEDLNLSIKTEFKKLAWGDKEISILQYLPVDEKFLLVGKVLNETIDEFNFYNPSRLKDYMLIETILAYTDLEFSEETLSNPSMFYDILVSTGFAKAILGLIPKEELDEIKSNLTEQIKAIYDYKNSLVGMMEALNVDFDKLSEQSEYIKENISDPENLKLLKNVVTKMG